MARSNWRDATAPTCPTCKDADMTDPPDARGVAFCNRCGLNFHVPQK